MNLIIKKKFGKLGLYSDIFIDILDSDDIQMHIKEINLNISVDLANKIKDICKKKYN